MPEPTLHDTVCGYCGEAVGHTPRCGVTRHGVREFRWRPYPVLARYKAALVDIRQQGDDWSSDRARSALDPEPTRSPRRNESFEQALARARLEKIPVMALRHDAQGLDDVVVETPKMFRAEMMDDCSLWMACYFANGELVTFWVTAVREKPRGKPILQFSVTEHPPEWWDWDEMRKETKADG